MAMSGLQIFTAFPSFGAKIPQQNLIDADPEAIRLGGWLGGALQWHFTFMWIFAARRLLYVSGQIVSGHFRTVLFRPRDVPGVWPMARHYFLFGPKPRRPASTTRCRSWPTRARFGFGAAVGPDRAGDVQAGAVLGAGLAVRRLSHARGCSISWRCAGCWRSSPVT